MMRRALIALFLLAALSYLSITYGSSPDPYWPDRDWAHNMALRR